MLLITSRDRKDYESILQTLNYFYELIIIFAALSRIPRELIESIGDEDD